MDDDTHTRTIRVPVHTVPTLITARRILRILIERLREDLSPEEIADLIDVPVEDVQALLSASRKPEDSSEAAEDKRVRQLLSTLIPPKVVLESQLGEQTRKVLATLTPREEQIIRMRLMKHCTFEEVGKELALTREEIRESEAKALRKLRQTGRSRGLKGFEERK